jgi:hypothetical protein
MFSLGIMDFQGSQKPCVALHFMCGFIFRRDGIFALAEVGSVSLTQHWSQRRLRLEFMDGLSYTTIIELAESLACRRGSALDC